MLILVLHPPDALVNISKAFPSGVLLTVTYIDFTQLVDSWTVVSSIILISLLKGGSTVSNSGITPSGSLTFVLSTPSILPRLYPSLNIVIPLTPAFHSSIYIYYIYLLQ